MLKWIGGCLLALAIIVGALCAPAHCETYRMPQVRVFIKDEGYNEKNIVKPRIYVENTGRQTIRNFDLYYYFTAERGKTPVVETYYAPNCTVSLVRENRREYAVRYRFRNIRLEPGQAFPDRSGCIVGIHYADWSEFFKEDDYSNPDTSQWKPTRKVEVEVSEDFRGGRGRGHDRDDDDDRDERY